MARDLSRYNCIPYETKQLLCSHFLGAFPARLAGECLAVSGFGFTPAQTPEACAEADFIDREIFDRIVDYYTEILFCFIYLNSTSHAPGIA